MRHIAFITILFSTLLASCVGDDYIEDRVDPIIKISNPLQSIAQDTTIKLEYSFKNNIGIEEIIEVEWNSENEEIATVDLEGTLTSLVKGNTIISVRASFEGQPVADFFELEVSEETVVEEVPTSRTGSLMPSSFYDLEGSFSLEERNESLLLTLDANYNADTGLPGLYVYLSNNPNSINGAKEIGKVLEFSGEHTYEIENTDLFDFSHVLYFCKPFNVKVGDGALSE